MNSIKIVAALFGAAYAQSVYSDNSAIDGTCKVTVITADGEEEVERDCNMYPDEATIVAMKPIGMIITGSGHELRQHPELTEWLVDEEYKKYENLELEIEHFQEPILRIIDPRTGKRKDIKLRDHSTKDALNSLLAKYEFERSG